MGSVAVLSASAEIEAGRYDCVLVLAVEQERNVPGADAPKHLGAAAWIGHEGQDAKFMWPYMFSQLADEYDRRYGLNDAHLHAIAGDDRDNPVVEGRLRRTDCAQVTDGVAGVLLVSDRYKAERVGGKPLARIAGWGHGTAALPLQPKLDRSQGQPYVFPHVRQVVADAFRRTALPVHLRCHQRAGLVPVQRAGQARHADWPRGELPVRTGRVLQRGRRGPARGRDRRRRRVPRDADGRHEP